MFNYKRHYDQISKEYEEIILRGQKFRFNQYSPPASKQFLKAKMVKPYQESEAEKKINEKIKEKQKKAVKKEKDEIFEEKFLINLKPFWTDGGFLERDTRVDTYIKKYPYKTPF